MRIGEALERLLSPHERGEESDASEASGGASFEAEMEAAAARERARRIPRTEDHTAAIVLDPRLVLDLSRPAQRFGTDGAMTWGDASRAVSERDVARSREMARVERETSAAVHSAADDRAAGGSRAEKSTRADAPSESDAPAREPADSQAQDAQDAYDARDSGGERGANGAAPSGESDGGSGDLGDADLGALAQRAAGLATAGSDGTPGARAARSGAPSDDDSRGGASSDPSVALAASGSSAGDGFGGAFDDGGDAGRGDASRAPLAAGATGAGPSAGDAVTGAPPFATALQGAMHIANASARPLQSAALAHESPAARVATAPAGKDAVLSLLSEGLAGALRSGQRELVVRLTPPHLGTIRLRFSFEERGVSARVEVSDPAVHRALESGLADLRGALQKHDVELRDLTFAAADRGGREAEGERARGEAEDSDDRRALEERAIAASLSPASSRTRAGSTGLDITA